MVRSEFPDEKQRAAVKGTSPVYTKAAATGDVVDVDESERTITAKISTDRTDSDMEIVAPGGLVWKRFEKNPVVLWMHLAHEPPIGKSLWRKVGKREVRAMTRFAETDFAQELFQLYLKGFLRGWSLGMDPFTLERREIRPEDIRKHREWAGARVMIQRAEVVEYSAVSIPCNQDALNKAFADGEYKLVKPRWEFYSGGVDKVAAMTHNGDSDGTVRPARVVRPIERLVRPHRLSVGDVGNLIDRKLRTVRGEL